MSWVCIDEADRVANELVAARAKAKLTQAQVARRMGTSQSAVARIESGRTPSLTSLRKYAKAVGRKVEIRLAKVELTPMSLSDIASIGSLVSGVAVLISLIYLALQVRQAERNQQASIRQGRATRLVDIILATSDPAMVEAMPIGAAGLDAITPTQFGQFIAIYGAFLASAEDTYLQYKEGLLSEAVFVSFAESWRRTLSQPGVRALWALRRKAFEAGFADFMDGLVAEVPVAQPHDFFAAWKAELAREKAEGEK